MIPFFIRAVFTISAFMFLSAAVFSQVPAKPVYSGGMLILQPGYTMTTSNHQTLSDLSFGIGGILRFYFLDYLTAGIYGGSQKTTYKSTNSENSYLNLGYGGPFLGFSYKTGKFRYTASVFAGKGSIKNLHIENQIKSSAIPPCSLASCSIASYHVRRKHMNNIDPEG